MAKSDTRTDIELNDNIKKLTQEIKKENSFKRNFLLSIVRGAGYAIGAGVVAGILLAILAAIFDALGGVPVLKDLLQNNDLGN